jgi:hypothetical protein
VKRGQATVGPGYNNIYEPFLYRLPGNPSRVMEIPHARISGSSKIASNREAWPCELREMSRLYGFSGSNRAGFCILSVKTLIPAYVRLLIFINYSPSLYIYFQKLRTCKGFGDKSFIVEYKIAPSGQQGVVP